MDGWDWGGRGRGGGGLSSERSSEHKIRELEIGHSQPTATHNILLILILVSFPFAIGLSVHSKNWPERPPEAAQKMCCVVRSQTHFFFLQFLHHFTYNLLFIFAIQFLKFLTSFWHTAHLQIHSNSKPTNQPPSVVTTDSSSSAMPLCMVAWLCIFADHFRLWLIPHLLTYHTVHSPHSVLALYFCTLTLYHICICIL